jgi:hypothetical protein
MTLWRRALVAVAVVLAAVVAASSATTARPDREPILFEDEVLAGLCPFPVLVEFIAVKEYITFFSDGRIHVTGKLFVRLTNLDEPENTMELNISGPAIISPLEERGAGRGLFLLFPEDVGGPGIVLTTGKVVVVRGEDGFITDLTIKGTTVDICAALA